MIHKLFTGTFGYALNSIIHKAQEDKAHGEKTTEEGQVATVPWKSQWTRTAPGVADKPPQKSVHDAAVWQNWACLATGVLIHPTPFEWQGVKHMIYPRELI